MTVKKTNNNIAQEFDKLSIQVSLNGLSFCILDTIAHKIKLSDTIVFENEKLPYDVQKDLAILLEKHALQHRKFSEVVVIHRNNLFSLVPKPLFDVNEKPNYLKFNTKILATDHIDFDDIEGFDTVNVYVPFMNINNYIYDLYGDFTFKHNGTVMVETLLKANTASQKPICYAHIANGQLDITVIEKKKLLLYNSFSYQTKEDLIYYLLFTLEQLQLDVENIILKLFGTVEEGDALYEICYEYIKNVSIFVPSNASYPFANLNEEAIDFTILNSL